MDTEKSSHVEPGGTESDADSFKSAHSNPTSPGGGQPDSGNVPSRIHEDQNITDNISKEDPNGSTSTLTADEESEAMDVDKASAPVEPDVSSNYEDNDPPIDSTQESPTPNDSRPTSEMSWNSELRALETSGENSPKPTTESLQDLDSSTEDHDKISDKDMSVQNREDSAKINKTLANPTGLGSAPSGSNIIANTDNVNADNSELKTDDRPMNADVTESLSVAKEGEGTSASKQGDSSVQQNENSGR